MEKFKTLVDKINVVLVKIVTVLFVLMSIACFVQILFRYALKLPLPWTEELARFLFVWVVFIGGAVDVKGKVHVGIDNFVEKLKLKPKRMVYTISYMLCIVMSAVISYYGFIVVQRMVGQASPAMRISMSYVYLAIPLGFLVSALNFIYLGLDLYMQPSK